MVGVDPVAPVGAGELAKVMKVPYGDELRLVEGQDLHLGLGGRDRVIGHVDIERAELEGVLEVLAAQVTPDLAEVAASALECPQGAQPRGGVRGQAAGPDRAQAFLYRQGDFQALAQRVGLAKLDRLQALQLGIKLPTHGQQAGLQLGQRGQQVARRQFRLGSRVLDARLGGQQRREHNQRSTGKAEIDPEILRRSPASEARPR